MSSSIHDQFKNLTREVVDQLSPSDAATTIVLIKRARGAMNITAGERDRPGTPYTLKASRGATRPEMARLSDSGGGGGSSSVEYETTEYLIAAEDLPAGIVPGNGDKVSRSMDEVDTRRAGDVIDAAREVDNTMWRVTVRSRRTG